MKKILLLQVLFWFMALAPVAFAQTTTPNLGLVIPEFEPGTWGEDVANNFVKLDTAAAVELGIARVTAATLPASPITNAVVVVTDALNTTTCTVGLGSN